MKRFFLSDTGTSWHELSGHLHVTQPRFGLCRHEVSVESSRSRPELTSHSKSELPCPLSLITLHRWRYMSYVGVLAWHDADLRGWKKSFVRRGGALSKHNPSVSDVWGSELIYKSINWAAPRNRVKALEISNWWHMNLYIYPPKPPSSVNPTSYFLFQKENTRTIKNVHERPT